MGKFVFHALIEQDPENGAYSSVCLENNVASAGDTPEEALASLKEAVRLYLDTVVKEHPEMFFRPAKKKLWAKLGFLLTEQRHHRTIKLKEVELVTA